MSTRTEFPKMLDYIGLVELCDINSILRRVKDKKFEELDYYAKDSERILNKISDYIKHFDEAMASLRQELQEKEKIKAA